jgi:flagellin-like protein
MDLDSRIRGQSQVIGVVLIVGIVVVLAGIAGVYIIDLFNGASRKRPRRISKSSSTATEPSKRGSTTPEGTSSRILRRLP